MVPVKACLSENTLRSIIKGKDLRIVPGAEYINFFPSSPDIFNTGIYHLVSVHNIMVLVCILKPVTSLHQEHTAIN